MKVMSGSGGAGEMKGLDVGGFYGDDAVLVLQRAFDEQKRVVDHDGVIFFELLRGDNNVSDAGFVFQTEKDEAFGGSRALADDDSSRYANERAVTEESQPGYGRNAAVIELRAVLRHRMVADSEPGAVKIGDQAFFVVHWIER